MASLITGPSSSSSSSTTTTRWPRPVLGAVVGACLLVAMVACSSDSSDGDKAAETTAKATSTTEADEATTSTTGGKATTTSSTAADSEGGEATPTTAGEADPSRFSGLLDGQDDVEVGFRREGANLVDFKAAGIMVTCLPLGDGEESTVSVDVDIDEVPVDEGGAVEFLLEDADYSPSLSGAFNEAEQFIGTLFLNGGDDESVCGGEFSFVAEAG